MDKKDRPPFDGNILNAQHFTQAVDIHRTPRIIQAIEMGYAQGFFVDTPLGRKYGEAGDFMLLLPNRKRELLKRDDFNDKDKWTILKDRRKNK